MTDSTTSKPLGPKSTILLKAEGFPATLEGRLEAINEWMYEERSPGICVSCRMTHTSVELDARGYLCEGCGEKKVVSYAVLWGLTG